MLNYIFSFHKISKKNKKNYTKKWLLKKSGLTWFSRVNDEIIQFAMGIFLRWWNTNEPILFYYQIIRN